MTPASTFATSPSVILYGAFDRHNFGDLLFPHIVAALLQNNNVHFAGLLQRDMRCYGGHQVNALSKLVKDLGSNEINIMIVGGEVLTCNAWQAAVMLLPPEQVQQVIARFDNEPAKQREWACKMLGIAVYAPYGVSYTMLHRVSRVVYNAVGGVELSDCDPAMRAEVVENLALAEEVSVRDMKTLSLLDAEGITAKLMPDPVVMVAELFRDKIQRCVEDKQMTQILQTFSNGYIAVQFSADYGDDATLIHLAGELDQAALENDVGIVFFRAGAAPWHDDLECYQRTSAHMQAPAKIFMSLNIWDICALISRSRLFCGSSLHGRIVAMAFALPRINLQHPARSNSLSKQAAFIDTWEQTDMPAVVNIDKLAGGVHLALETSPIHRQEKASELVARYRQGFERI